MKYTCNDIFMIRTPSLPVNVFTDFMHDQQNTVQDFIIRNKLDTFFDKSILISSRNLYEAMQRQTQLSGKKNKGKELSLIKFLIRSSTRPTPYGLFAGAALGAFSDEASNADIIVDEKKAVIECNLDQSWLSHFIYELENNSLVYPQLKVRFNNNCYVSGDRLKNPYYSNHGFVKTGATAVNRNHIRNTPLIAYIRQVAQGFIEYDALKLSIQNKYPEAPGEMIVSTINMLMENEILLTNLRVPSNCHNGLEYVLHILKPVEGIEDMKEALRQVTALVNQFNHERELEQIAVTAIQSIYALMEGLLNQASEKDLLAVNKGVILKHNNLPHALKHTVENFVEGLACLQMDTVTKLTKFRHRFQEEYGSHIEVPLYDIIDPNQFNGLAYIEEDEPTKDERGEKIKQIVDEKILYCLQFQGEEVALSQKDFASLDPIDESKLSTSFDINFFVTKEVDRYHLTIAPIGGSLSAGDMFNRFGNVLDAGLFDQYQDNNKRGVAPDPDLITVEIRESTQMGRLANINNHGSKHEYYIALATNDDNSEAQELSLDDFVVGLQNDRLYLKSKSLGKRCHVVQDCMVNQKMLSDVTRLLLYISLSHETDVIAPIFYLYGNQYNFVPRILFEGVVIQPKSWYLPSHLFDLKTLQSFTDSFQILREKYRIDDLVYLKESDTRLMLHLDKQYSYDILYKNIQKHKIVIFHELERNVLTDSISLDSNGNHYVTEISCSFTLNATKNHGIVLDNQVAYALQNENRPLLLLQDGWVYARLYNMDDRENEVLSYIPYVLNNIGNPKFFFLRYMDETGRHLRVRFKYSDEHTAQAHMAELEKMLISFREYKLINNVIFDIYNRENNRYGGSRLITFAEDVFFADSLFVINLLNELNVEEEADLEQAYLLGICTMLTAFHENIEDMFVSANRSPLQEAHKKTFRGNKQGYIKTVEHLISRDFSSLSDQTVLLIAQREEAVRRYDEEIRKTDPLTNTRESIIASIIHMFCNRLRGNMDLEEKYLNITRESLSNIIEKHKRVSKKGV